MDQELIEESADAAEWGVISCTRTAEQSHGQFIGQL